MALGTATLEQLRNDLRARLPKENRSEILNSELDRFLNLGQYDASLKLSGINSIWYGTTQTVTVSGGAIDISGYSIMRIIKLVDADNGIIPFYDEKYFEELSRHFEYDSSRAATHFGQSITIYEGGSAPTIGTLTLYYYRKPAQMSSDSDTLDVPDEFQDIVVSFAEKKAMQRLGIPTTAKEEELMLAWQTIQRSFSNEFSLERAEERGVDK